jgi:selenocysteine lyase/cysteine desulfurase
MKTSLADLLADESLRQQCFPVVREKIFLAHAGVAPLCGPALHAVELEARAAGSEGQERADFMENVTRARAAAAALLDAKPSEIALLGPTSLGLNLVALGLDWRPGDQVVFYPDDYPANVYPWQMLEPKGVELIRLAPPHPGAITIDLVRAALTPRTKLVALASCHYLSGWRIDIDAIGWELRQRGILFCLDAIQSLGVTPVSVQQVDFLSADAHKWLLGPNGAGIFYVREEVQDRLVPALPGAWNVVSPGFIAQDVIQWESTARRYEPGSLNLLGIAGLSAACEFLHQVGIGSIHRRTQHLRSHAIEAIRKSGGSILHADAPETHASPILAIPLDPAAARITYKRLLAEGIIASLRHDRHQAPFLRLSPHFYNLESDLEAAIAILQNE